MDQVLLEHQATQALRGYDLGSSAELTRQLDGTHAAFQVAAGNRMFALRQYNPYMVPEHLSVQLRLVRLLADAGLPTITPTVARDGRYYSEAADRLWALFPWYPGRPGSAENIEDLRATASLQGTWVAACEALRASPCWENITQVAGAFRQRKDWAWVIPRDRIPGFFEEHRIAQLVRSRTPDGPLGQAFLGLIPRVEAGLGRFGEMLTKRGVHQMPHTVTHGDFGPMNIRLSDSGPVVLDLDCFSCEPRVTDFARNAGSYYSDWPPDDRQDLFWRFQERAQLSRDELEILPLMMCAENVYYAVGHLLLFVMDSPEEQKRLLPQIRHEISALDRLPREEGCVLRSFLGRSHFTS